ncbi:MAG TPA: hypothetical protein VJN62_07640 [Gemmatimonadales bacterium]|nr:hypothetical protein [Gemmatimonadales bacterium]
MKTLWILGVLAACSTSRPPADLVTSFDGLGHGFNGPQGQFTGRNPSDNTLAVGPEGLL